MYTLTKYLQLSVIMCTLLQNICNQVKQCEHCCKISAIKYCNLYTVEKYLQITVVIHFVHCCKICTFNQVRVHITIITLVQNICSKVSTFFDCFTDFHSESCRPSIRIHDSDSGKIPQRTFFRDSYKTCHAHCPKNILNLRLQT